MLFLTPSMCQVTVHKFSDSDKWQFRCVFLDIWYPDTGLRQIQKIQLMLKRFESILSSFSLVSDSDPSTLNSLECHQREPKLNQLPLMVIQNEFVEFFDVYFRNITFWTSTELFVFNIQLGYTKFSKLIKND